MAITPDKVPGESGRDPGDRGFGALGVLDQLDDVGQGRIPTNLGRRVGDGSGGVVVAP
jgi:hypothetical protein